MSERYFGPIVPPGVVYPDRLPIPLDKLDSIGTLDVRILGRVRYRDDFGTYCEPFCVTRWAGTGSIFELCSAPQRICEPGKFHSFFTSEILGQVGPAQASLECVPAGNTEQQQRSETAKP